MTDKVKLNIVKGVHTLIYLIMVMAIGYVWYAALTKTYNLLLLTALLLLSIEGLVYFGNGMKCPFTVAAKNLGDEKGYVGDVFLPEKIAVNTFRIFGTILAIGLVILAVRYFFGL